MVLNPVVVAAVGAALSERSAEYLRIASISVAAYDYILTLPDEYRFYRTQKRWTRPSLACLLFALIRYSSILILVISNIGQFATFSSDACERYYLLAPVFKVPQIFISQVILAVRTFALSRQNRTIGLLLVIAVVVCTTGEGFGSIYGRVPYENTGHCVSGNHDGAKFAYLHYVFGMSFDLFTMAISTWYLVGDHLVFSFSFQGISRMMLVDGLGYFAMLTAVNVVNVVIWVNAEPDVQSAAASLGYAFTMIGCTRMLIHIRDFADKPVSDWIQTSGRPTQANVMFAQEGNAMHDMAIRVTIQRDIEAGADENAKSNDNYQSSGTLNSSGKNPRSFIDV
ncbi:hypothetical protein BKA62DRAFT_704194 [Auriculariales sp. MPI-PUGE-AT-0066]|nr:hypothetical protein BKA62DRAFT_704194 [Auriculariales sp. MPI-PUGE-AT-0066]